MYALAMAGLGWSMCNRCWKYHHNNCTPPATAGAEKLVPDSHEYSISINWTGNAGAHTSMGTLQSTGGGVSGNVGASGSQPRPVGPVKTDCEMAPKMDAPGATTSGLNRPSRVLPNDEKNEMSNESSESSTNRKHPSKGRAFSEAPTVMMFLAVAGGVTSTSPNPPIGVEPFELPPAKMNTISWFNGLPSDSTSPLRTESRTSAS